MLSLPSLSCHCAVFIDASMQGHMSAVMSCSEVRHMRYRNFCAFCVLFPFD